VGGDERMSYSRPQSSRSRPPSGRSNLTTPTTYDDIKYINEPLHVNRKYCGNDDPITPRNMKPMLPPSRFPTVYAGPDIQIKKKKLSCPEGWIENQRRTETPLLNTPKTRNRLAQEFIDNNLDHIQGYRQEYRDQSPRTIQTILSNSKSFGTVMNELQTKERVRKLGTSSQQINSSFNEHGARSVHELSWDPNISSLTTSRSKRENQVQRLFSSTISLHATEKTFNRGYSHAPEYKNFSSYQSCLIKNKGTMLSR
jgi:hypothetical protein